MARLQMNQIPNLDAMDADALMALWKVYHTASRNQCFMLIGDKRPGYTRLVTSTLSNYCANKATAMRLRLKGEIVRARDYENICDRIYNDIPSDLRW